MTRALPCLPLLVLGACHGIQSPLAPAGDQAGALHSLFVLMIVVTGAVYLLVLAGVGWSVQRARAQRKAMAAPPSDRRIDAGLYSAAAVIVIGLTVLIVASFVADRALIAARHDDALRVRVTGHQWWWRIEYRDPASGRWIETANELHLPQGRTTRVELAAGDVIHSFWVPNVAGKIDMIPGRRNLIDLTPRETGWYRGQCAEFCGLQHAHMALDVKVESPADFAGWLAGQARPAPPPSQAPFVSSAVETRARAPLDFARGERGSRVSPGTAANVFLRACAPCHTVRGTPAGGRAGPDLTHFASRRSIASGTLPMSRGGIQGWLAQPQALKPGTSMPTVPLVPADADAVASYLETLR